MFGLSELATRIVGGILIVLAIFGFGYYKGHHSVQVQFDQYKTEITAKAEAQAAETAKKDDKNKKLILETKNAYNTQLAALRTYYGMRLAKGSGAVPSLPNATSGVDGYSPDNLPPTAVLAAQCAETTLTLLRLQEFNANIAKNLE